MLRGKTSNHINFLRQLDAIVLIALQIYFLQHNYRVFKISLAYTIMYLGFSWEIFSHMMHFHV